MIIIKKRYMITYDLNKTGQDYENVIKTIKSASDGNWCTFWKSSFLIRSDYQTASEINSLISQYLDNNDRLIVIEVINNNSGWLTKEQWQYISDNIFA